MRHPGLGGRGKQCAAHHDALSTPASTDGQLFPHGPEPASVPVVQVSTLTSLRLHPHDPDSGSFRSICLVQHLLHFPLGSHSNFSDLSRP